MGAPSMMRAVHLDPLRSARAGIALIGTSGAERGLVLRANREFADLLGTSSELLAGTSLCDHVPSEDRAEAEDALLALLADSDSLYERGGRLVAAGGEVVAVQLVASVLAHAGRPVVLMRVLPRSRPRG